MIEFLADGISKPPACKEDGRGNPEAGCSIVKLPASEEEGNYFGSGWLSIIILLGWRKSRMWCFCSCSLYCTLEASFITSDRLESSMGKICIRRGSLLDGRALENPSFPSTASPKCSKVSSLWESLPIGLNTEREGERGTLSLLSDLTLFTLILCYPFTPNCMNY